jgi:hypothetical protein
MADFNIDEIKREQKEDRVVDEAELDDRVIPLMYRITSFGADYDAAGLVSRLQREDIFIPPFQRSFVWTQKEASRFIESLLLGLPVPGVFFARDTETKKLLVIDGQQRLRSIQYFVEGYFNPSRSTERKTVFKLLNVQKRWEGLTYETISEADRILLRDTIIHATIVQQDSPKEKDHSSIYMIFERLNTTGRKLSPQQIRVAIYHGKFLNLLNELNEYKPWREIFGNNSKTLKDQELILRFIALNLEWQQYGDTEDTSTIKGFLNNFTYRKRSCDDKFCETNTSLFKTTIDTVLASLGKKAFRPERALNTAVFDSVMVGIASRLNKGEITNVERLKSQYQGLFQDEGYLKSIERATSDTKSVKTRCDMAIRTFSDV